MQTAIMFRFNWIKKYAFLILSGICLQTACISLASAQPVLHHELHVRLEPHRHMLTAMDRIRVSQFKQNRIGFALAGQLEIQSVRLNGQPADYVFKGGHLSILLADGQSSHELQIHYSGVFNDQAPEQPLNTDNPGFGVSGTIGSRGTLLLAGANWYPHHPNMKSIYTLSVDAPEGISAVTAGHNLGHRTVGGRTLSRWSIEQPLRGLSLVAGAYRPATRQFGRITAATYFTPDLQMLSSDYLKAAGRYLALYEELFGPYPFEQFSIVENFFPTGYGFPSFTLMGRRVLRLPFIIHTSLGHEIAHCWWGNGVLVDTALGNWSEGLTSYVADYLYKEQRGLGVSHRRQWLRNYAGLVPIHQEFALTRFMSRTDPLTKAIGYDKAAMVFHMLRRKVGDDLFWQTLRDVYGRYRFQAITWQHWKNAFEQSSGTSLEAFFQQWVHRRGAPQLFLSDTHIISNAAGYTVNGTLLQHKPYYDLQIDLVLETESTGIKRKISLAGGEAQFSIFTTARPTKLTVDPQVHLFRRLGPGELPPTVNTIKGDGALMIVVSGNLDKRWMVIAHQLRTALGVKDAVVAHESNISLHKLSDTNVVWLGMPGDESQMPETNERIVLGNHEIRLLEQTFARKNTSFFGMFEQDRQPGRVVGLFLPATFDLAATLCAKIPHYGKYSYLLFNGPRNVAKGTWPVATSEVVVTWAAGAIPARTGGE
jgi:hypothetical protein